MKKFKTIKACLVVVITMVVISVTQAQPLQSYGDYSTPIGSALGSQYVPLILTSYTGPNVSTSPTCNFFIEMQRHTAGIGPGTVYTRLTSYDDPQLLGTATPFIDFNPKLNYGGITLGSGTTNTLSVTNAGNVGIGTVTPGAKFHVYDQTTLGSAIGSISNIANFSSLSSNFSQLKIQLIRHTVGTAWNTAATRIQAITDVSNQAYIDFNPLGNPWGMALGLATNNPVLSIVQVNGGVVKIGTTTTPVGYKLYVQTGILTEKVKVAVATSAQWADYVFAKEYKLMPLTDVEQFVKTNSHLPNVLSAKEMVNEGNDLGATDAKLLEKIEELTLYMIEMKKENVEMKKTIESQNNKLAQLEISLNK